MEIVWLLGGYARSAAKNLLNCSVLVHSSPGPGLVIDHGWHMHSLDFVMAYPQTNIKTNIFMHIPCECTVPSVFPSQLILKHGKNLYGLNDTTPGTNNFPMVF